MRLKISLKNSKIGEVPNLSLPPGITCVEDIPYFTEGCYARNSFRRFPNVKKAWNSNLDFYMDEPLNLFSEFDKWLTDNKPERFRLFVGGDFPDPIFYLLFEQITIDHPEVDFLVFTKRYDYDFSYKPKNLQVILSTWPGHPLPLNKGLPWSWLEGDPRKPETYIRCPGNCSVCGHECWGTVIPVAFPKH